MNLGFLVAALCLLCLSYILISKHRLALDISLRLLSGDIGLASIVAWLCRIVEFLIESANEFRKKLVVLYPNLSSTTHTLSKSFVLAKVSLRSVESSD